MGVVLQDGKLMAGDVITNIGGSMQLTQDEAWEAAYLSGLDEDIERGVVMQGQKCSSRRRKTFQESGKSERRNVSGRFNAPSGPKTWRE